MHPHLAFKFNFYLDFMVEQISCGRTAGHCLGTIAVFCFMFADDVVLLAESFEELQISLNHAHKFAGENFLVLNLKRCFTLVVKGKKRREFPVRVTVGDAVLAQVKSFDYLGWCVNEKLCPELSGSAQSK